MTMWFICSVLVLLVCFHFGIWYVTCEYKCFAFDIWLVSSNACIDACLLIIKWLVVHRYIPCVFFGFLYAKIQGELSQHHQHFLTSWKRGRMKLHIALGFFLWCFNLLSYFDDTYINVSYTLEHVKVPSTLCLFVSCCSWMSGMSICT